MHIAIRSFAFSFLTLFACHAFGANPDASLGKRGKILLEEKFDGGAVPAGWNKNTGKVSVADGALHASQLASDNHIGAFRKLMPLQDCVVQLDFKFSGATMFHVGFDPAPGELKKKGHLFALAITPQGWSLNENPDKDDPKSKNVTHAKAATKFNQGEWYTLLLEMKGGTVVVRVGDRELRATAKDFQVKKPGLVFRAGGKDGEEVLLDNVKVWELL